MFSDLPPPFDRYRHKRRYMEAPAGEPEHWIDPPSGAIRLFRYVGEWSEAPIRAHSWWSEMESGWSDFAGEATGIGANSCRFRIEWLCPLDIALEHVHVGAARMCKAGFIHEYMTLIEVGQTDVSWHEMHDWGPFPPR